VILVDTSIWIDHLRKGDLGLFALLSKNEVLMHPFVLGELALGDLHDRASTLQSLQRLPTLPPARDWEVLALIESAKLYTTGLGYIDAHLLCAVRLMPSAELWTRDARLAGVADRLGIGAATPNAP
jgi:predicted nucleic acid-binding protein